jgi:hypothetical protein
MHYTKQISGSDNKIKIIWKIVKRGTGKHSIVEEILSVKVILYTVLNLQPTLHYLTVKRMHWNGN